jgi:uncharacterized protein YceK
MSRRKWALVVVAVCLAVTVAVAKVVMAQAVSPASVVTREAASRGYYPTGQSAERYRICQSVAFVKGVERPYSFLLDTETGRVWQWEDRRDGFGWWACHVEAVEAAGSPDH